MKLLYLHGPPAAGKRTVAEAITKLVRGRLFDNHAAVDFARTVLDFDAPGFWNLVHSARLLALDEAAQQNVPLVVQTSCYSHPTDLPQLEDFKRLLARHGGELLPVFLTCSRKALEDRVGASDRRTRRKVTTVEGLESCLSRWNLVPVPRANCFTISTYEIATPAESAATILAHFHLSDIAGQSSGPDAKTIQE